MANCRNGPLSANYDRKKNFTISQEKPYNFSWSRIAEMGHFLQITIARKTRPFLKKNYTISPDRKLQNRATFCKLRSQKKLDHFSWSRIVEMGHFLQITIARKTLPFLKKSYTISPDRKLQNRATFCKLRSQEKLDHFSWSRIAEMGHFLQITIARKTLPFLKKNYTISPDRKLQNRATFCKLRSQEKLYHFSKKTTQFLVMTNCRNGPLSANYDRKKNFTICQERPYNFSWSQIAEMGHFLQITIVRKTIKFLKKNYTKFSRSRIAEMGHFLQITIARKTIQFLLIANCRRGPLFSNHDRKKYSTVSQEKLYNFSWSWIAEMGHFLQITIARKTLPFLKKNYTISPYRKLQNRATFCKLRSQGKLDHFSRKTTQFLIIRNCRNGPLSANYDRKKNLIISQEKPYNFSWSRIAEMGHFLQITIARKTRPFLKKNYTISRDRELQKWATFCKLRSQEELDHFSRKARPFLVITNCRNGPLSANYDCKKNFAISQEKLYNFSWSQIIE